MATVKLKASDIKQLRQQMVRKQRYKCPLCNEPLKQEDAVLDHCHDTGHIRHALHRSCNAAEGRIKEWAGKRSRGDCHHTFVRNLVKYWDKDYTANPLHHTHGAAKRKRKRRPRMKKR